MARQDQERQARLEPERITYARAEIEKLGYETTKISATEITFEYFGNIIRMFPYSGWHQGKGIKSGRGLKELLNQI